MKAIASPPVSIPRIYRHFAVVTVAATLLVAVFADGENREALASAAKPARAQAAASPVKLSAQETQDDRSEGSFGPSSGQFGAPMASPGGGRDSALRTVGPRQIAASYNPTGLSEAELAKLTPAQREELLQKLREQRYGASPELRAQQVAGIVRASAQRSGSSPGDDD